VVDLDEALRRVLRDGGSIEVRPPEGRLAWAWGEAKPFLRIAAYIVSGIVTCVGAAAGFFYTIAKIVEAVLATPWGQAQLAALPNLWP
jgi:hypothetical protein